MPEKPSKGNDPAGDADKGNEPVEVGNVVFFETLMSYDHAPIDIPGLLRDRITGLAEEMVKKKTMEWKELTETIETERGPYGHLWPVIGLCGAVSEASEEVVSALIREADEVRQSLSLGRLKRAFRKQKRAERRWTVSDLRGRRKGHERARRK